MNNPQTKEEDVADLLIIGGGINGAGIARDASGRGMRVILAEQGDLAQATSSRSTKLIHGGLRYLEHYDFRLVREALIERERLINIAPQIIWPLRFVLPHRHDVRPAWLIRLGLFLYDHIGGSSRLPASSGVRLQTSRLGSGLKPDIVRGFVYSDAWVEDSRLVVLNARDAAERGAAIHTRTRVTKAAREGRLWVVELEDVRTRERRQVRARAMVNAAGPWVGEVLHHRATVDTDKNVRLIKGSHIVIPRLYEGEHACILQNPDRRVIFAIPYEHDHTLVGTTDVPYDADPSDVRISQDEIEYLCRSLGRYFTRPIRASDVVWSYAGIRPLYDDAAKNASAVTRDYVLDVNAPAGAAPLLSVFGGKITTYRRLAEHALEKLIPHLPVHGPAWGRGWTDRTPLPGGDMPNADFDLFLADLRRRAPFLSPELALRLGRAYGTRVWRLLGHATSMAELGEEYGRGLTEAEITYLQEEEWAQTSEDILWRRSKLGLHLSPASAQRVETRMSGDRQVPRHVAE